MTLLHYAFAQRALVAALLIGFVGPLIGVFLVQRRLALLGDGIGHVALTGVGLALLVGWAPLPTAAVAAAIGAVLIEIIRERSRTAGDLALALLFYGGIAGGVMLASLAPGGSTALLNTYLFGSLTTVSAGDLWVLVVLAVVTTVLLALWGRQLFAVGLDADVARVQGLQVSTMNTLLAALAAVSVVIGMRVVGLLLVSAIMIVPVAAAQQLTRSFRTTMIAAVGIGLASALSGLFISFNVNVPPGPSIVLLALAVFGVLAITAAIRRRRSAPQAPVHQHTPDGGFATEVAS